MKINLQEKRYYSIGEVASKFNVNPSLIRFWEQEFKILNPKKNSRGIRKFTKKDINNLSKIYFLLKKRGYTIQGARDYICLLYTSPSPRDLSTSRMPSSA